MVILVDDEHRVSLQAGNEFRAFELQAPAGTSHERLASALDGVAVLEGDGFAWVLEAWLIDRLLLEPPAPDWRVSLDSMVRFAESKGWVRNDPRRIRAHVVQAP
jgi:hypothetical protein